MKNIQIIHTGGTIAMTNDPESHTVNTNEVNPLHSMTKLLNQYAKVQVDDYINIPSPHMTPKLMLKLSHRIKQYLDSNLVDGVVITHGTDTLEETAYFLDLALSSLKPIVVTGAMRSSNELSADGPLNLVHAVQTAASRQAQGKGVLVVFNEEIHAARHVTKMHTSHIDTFQSPEYGPLGYISKQEVYFQQALLKRECYQVEAISKNIYLIKAVAGMDLDWINYLPDDSYHGLVIEAFGLGNLPLTLLPILEKLINKGIPVILTSRCPKGSVEPSYAYSGGGKHLEEMGVIFTNSLSGQKARLKLMIALEHCSTMEELRQFFDKKY